MGQFEKVSVILIRSSGEVLTSVRTLSLRKESLFHRLFLLTIVCIQLWVGVMLTTQSFFIAGIEDEEKAKSSAFGAMGCFIFTFAASVAGIWYDSNKSPSDIVETDMPESEYQLQTDNVRSYGTSA